MINYDTYYTAFSVLKQYLEKKGYTVNNVNLYEQSPDRVVMWIDENSNGCTHCICIKCSYTQFLIWEYDNNGNEIFHTSVDKAKPKG